MLFRSAGLMQPAVLLFVFAFVASCVLHAVAPVSLQRNLGVLMVQLTWFLGGYMLFIALAPLLIRLSGYPGIVSMLAVIAGVDWLRLHVSESLGWLNMLLVWAFFTIIGTRKDTLRRAPVWLRLLSLVLAAAAAALLITYGPYSKALITANGLPGISNLAPPTLVLACAGVAQILALTLVWPALQRWLNSDRVWVPVAIFGSRAMQVYLYHMLVLVVVVSPFIARRSVTQPLSLAWWGQHALVFVVTLSVVMLGAPALRRASSALASAVLVRPWPAGMRRRLAGMSRGRAQALAATSGVLLLVQSTTGIGDFLTPRAVVGVQVYPLVTWTLLMLCISVQLLAAPTPTADAASDRVEQ